jgi:E3 SUMO-protein ligase PIAS1
MANHRNSIQMIIKAQDPAMTRALAEQNMKILIFCSGGNTGTQDISFPYQSELKVNGMDTKANLRGLKNKPGSTRPVDITNALRFKPLSYPNNIEFTYAITGHRFYFGAYLCKVMPVSSLIERIQQHGKRISKSSVISELTKNANDPDLVATSQVVSLKCPLSYMRLSVPCRGISCRHISCFDAVSYLQLQEQGPQWLCPICNKPAPFDQLAIDE